MKDRTKEFREITGTSSANGDAGGEDEDAETKRSGKKQTSAEAYTNRARHIAQDIFAVLQSARMLGKDESVSAQELMARARKLSSRIHKLENGALHDEDKKNRGEERVTSDEISHRKGVINVLYCSLRIVTVLVEEVQRENYRMASIVAQSKRGSYASSSLLLGLSKEHVASARAAYETETKKRVSEVDIESRWSENATLDPIELKTLMLENEQLELELTSQLDDVLEMHAKMTEIAKVCSFLNNKVQEQHWQVEHLNDDAVRSTQLVRKSQKELTEAIANKGSSRDRKSVV